MRLVGRLFLLFVACALVAWAVWTFALDRSDVRRDLFTRATDAHYRDAKPRPVEAEAFRVTACPGAECVLVEAGGLSFLFGGGSGVAEALFDAGLFRSNLDGVFLTGLSPDGTAGLASLSSALAAAGRAEPLTIHGPSGIAGVVEGVNRLLRPEGLPEGATPPLVAGTAEADTTGGVLVFDSGVVQVTRRSAGSFAVYRVDFDGRALVLAGCGVAVEDMRNTARGTARAFGVIAVASDWMIETQRQAAAAAGLKRDRAGAFDPAACLTPESAVTAAQDAGLASVMLAPLWPRPEGPAERVWREIVEAPADLAVVVGLAGATLDVEPAVAVN